MFIRPALYACLSFVFLSGVAVADLRDLHPRASPDPSYATVITPSANTTVKLDGSSFVNLLYYGIGGDSYKTQNIRLYIADFNATHPDGFDRLAGDQRYGLEAYMTVPPNSFQPGSMASEMSANSFNAYNYSLLPLPRANVTNAFTATLSILETYSAPNDEGLLRENRVAIPIKIATST